MDEIVTWELIKELEGPSGSWHKASLAYLGIEWPPKAGWKHEIVGKPRKPLWHSLAKDCRPPAVRPPLIVCRFWQRVPYSQRPDYAMYFGRGKQFRYILADTDKLALLRAASELYLPPTDDMSLKEARQEFKDAPEFKQLFWYACWVCGSDVQCRHHIFELRHYGMNNICNLVPLCNQCHANVHPWMDGHVHNAKIERAAYGIMRGMAAFRDPSPPDPEPMLF